MEMIIILGFLLFIAAVGATIFYDRYKEIKATYKARMEELEKSKPIPPPPKSMPRTIAVRKGLPKFGQYKEGDLPEESEYETYDLEQLINEFDKKKNTSMNASMKDLVKTMKDLEDLVKRMR